MRKFLITSLFFLLFFSIGYGKVVECIVAQVNKDCITLSRLNKELSRLKQYLKSKYQGAEYEKELKKSESKLLNNIIDEMLLLQKAKEMGMDEDLDLEAESIRDRIMKDYGVPSLDALKESLRRRGITYDEYMENLKKQILIGRIRGAVLHRNVKILSEDVKKYYEGHKDEFRVPALYHLREIVVYTKDKKDEVAKKKIEDAFNELKEGKDFKAVAINFSEGATAKNGGDLGEFKLSELSPQIAKVVKNLKVGSYSGIIKTDFGYEIVQLVSKKDSYIKPFKEVKDKIENKLFNKESGPAMKKYIKELRSESYIYVFPPYRKYYTPEKEGSEGNN